MRAIKKLASRYTIERLCEGMLATVIAWFVCVIAGGVYWSYVDKAGVDIFLVTVTVITGIELLIDGILLVRLKGKK